MEVAPLREEVARLRSTHARLARQVQTMERKKEELVATLSQLNGKLLAQTEARPRAEQTSTSCQAQLRLILSRKASNTASQTDADEAEEPENPSRGRSYNLVEGDTLETISKKFYDLEASWRKIFDANRDQLRDDRRPKVGMQLVIPE
jgi:nucleoid-associated protein YgaU